MPAVRRPLYVLAFLLLLGVPQAVAFVQQFRGGYRPFRAAPHRVPFSWDMFSVRIDRCDIAWDHPLPAPGGPFSRLHDKAKPFEWDFTLDRVEDYKQLASWTCARFRQPFHAVLICFTAEGKLVSDAVECR